jgi:hypothetical protein
LKASNISGLLKSDEFIEELADSDKSELSRHNMKAVIVIYTCWRIITVLQL